MTDLHTLTQQCITKSGGMHFDLVYSPDGFEFRDDETPLTWRAIVGRPAHTPLDAYKGKFEAFGETPEQAVEDLLDLIPEGVVNGLSGNALFFEHGVPEGYIDARPLMPANLPFKQTVDRPAPMLGVNDICVVEYDNQGKLVWFVKHREAGS